MTETFTCAWCRGTFAKAWTDEEALTESLRWFGEIPREDWAVICDDCYDKFHPADHPKEVACAIRAMKGDA